VILVVRILTYVIPSGRYERSEITVGQLTLSKIPYEKWLKFMMPLFLILMGWSAVFLAIAVMINY